MVSIRICHWQTIVTTFLFSLSSVFPFCNAALPQAPPSGLSKGLSGEGISFEAALQLEASIQIEQARPRSVTALPIPSEAQQEADYNGVLQLANAPLPPVHITAADSDAIAATVQDILAKAYQKDSVSPSLDTRQSTLRVMIVGDSISQGQQGDTTWRYRIWQWFQSQNVAVQFVGPYTGTFQSTCALATGPQSPPQPPPLYGSTTTTSSPTNNLNGAYANGVSSGFLSDDSHFSVWGRALAVDQGLIQNVLQNHMADLILLELGFNDMGWFYSDCYGTIDSLHSFINNARAANPNVNFAVANVPQRTFIREDLVTNISTYNQILPGYLEQWSTTQSVIRLVDFSGNYDCGTTSCPAGYDGLHPNGWGEYQIANAFSKSLIAGFGIGSTPLAIPSQSDPSVQRDIDQPGNFQVYTSATGVTATWDAVFGAYSYDVQVSINGGGGGFSAGGVSVNRWDSTWSVPGWNYAVMVRAACGDEYGPWTSLQTAVAEPELAPAPQNIVVASTSDGFTVTWDPPTGPYTDDIVEYNIIYWDTEPSDCQYVTGAAFTSSPGTVSGLLTGRRYLVAPLTWNSNGQGLPYIANSVIPGSGAPSVPTNLQAISNDGTSVHLTWSGSEASAGYEVFFRNATGGPYISLANTSAACTDDYFLFPGTYTYEFCVAAYNGNEYSPQGSGVIPPHPPSPAVAAVTCPAAPSWCPSGSGGSGGYVGGCADCGNDGCPSGGCINPTGTSPGGPKATPSTSPEPAPSAGPGSANNADWRNVTCDYGSLTNAGNPGYEQWDDAGATAAWIALYSSWIAEAIVDGAEGFTFSNYVANFFHARPQLQCENVGDLVCSETLTCGQYNMAGDVDSPAGYIIINSMVAIHDILESFNNAIVAAKVSAIAEIGQFVTQFSVVENTIVATAASEARTMRDFLIAQVVLGFIIAPLFNLALTKVDGWDEGDIPDYLETAGSVLQTEIFNAFAGEELSFQTQNIAYTTYAFSDYVDTVMNSWENATQQLATAIFSHPEQLFGLINNGTFMTNVDFTPTAFQAQTNLVRALFANILGLAWSGGAEVGQPFVLTSDGLTSNGSPVTSCSYDPFADWQGLFNNAIQTHGGASTLVSGEFPTESNVGSQTCFVVQGKVYWLAMLTSVFVPPVSNRAGTTVGYWQVTPGVPVGQQGLNGTSSQFGGLKLSTVQENIVNTWNHNNQKNVFNTDPSTITLDQIRGLESADLTTLYELVPIPACSIEVLAQGIVADQGNSKGSKLWPCGA